MNSRSIRARHVSGIIIACALLFPSPDVQATDAYTYETIVIPGCATPCSAPIRIVGLANNGRVGGTFQYDSSDGMFRSFVWQNRSFTDLSKNLPYTVFNVISMNESGDFTAVVSPDTVLREFAPARVTDRRLTVDYDKLILDIRIINGSESLSRGFPEFGDINDDGLLVRSYLESISTPACVTISGPRPEGFRKVTEFGGVRLSAPSTPPRDDCETDSSNVVATRANNAGTVIGYWEYFDTATQSERSVPVIFRNGAMQALPDIVTATNLPPGFTIPDYDRFEIGGLNDAVDGVHAEQFLVTAYTSTGISHVYIYDGQTYTYIDEGSGGDARNPRFNFSSPINNKGQIIYYILNEGSVLWLPSADYGLAAGKHPIRDLVALPPPHTLLPSATFLNDNGQMIAGGKYLLSPSGYVHPELEPYDELVEDESAANNSATGENGDPVNTYTGELVLRPVPDLAIEGPLPLTFTRYFASRMDPPGLLPAQVSNPLAGVLGRNWSHNYDWRLLVMNTTTREPVVVTDPRGRKTTFSLNDTGSAYVQQEGLDVPMALRETGTGWTLADLNSSLRYEFDPAGLLAAIRDNAGNALTLLYNSSGQLIRVSDDYTHGLEFSYNSEKRLTGVTDGSRTVSFTYTNDLLVSFTNAAGNVKTFLYDDRSNLVSIVQPEGNTPYTQVYDPFGRVVSQTDALGNEERFDYQGSNTVITRADNSTLTHTYQRGALTGVSDSSGAASSTGFSKDGLQDRITDPEGNTSQFSIGSNALISSAIWPDTSETSYTYTTYSLDGLAIDALASITFRDGTTESYIRDAIGHITSVTDRGGYTTTYQYASVGKPDLVTNAAGGVTRRTWDLAGNLASETSPAGNTTLYSYDSLGRLSGVTHPDGSGRSYIRNALNRVVSITLENGAVTTSVYDTNDRLVSRQDSLGNQSLYTYDDLDRLSALTFPEGNTTMIGYDERGRVSSTTSGTGSTRYFSYDNRGNLTTLIDGNNQSWLYQYTQGNLLARKTSPLGDVQQFSYDAMNRLSSLTDAEGGVVSFGYDVMDRLTRLEDQIGNTTTYSYDALGELIGIQLADGSSANYSRNVLGLPVAIIDPSGDSWLYEYNNGGQLISATDPLGRSTSYRYDSRERLDRLVRPDTTVVDLTYDDIGNIVQRKYDTEIFSYQFDTEGRETAADGLTLTYDRNGNIIESNGIAVTYDADDNISGITFEPGKTVSYTYDGEDRVTSITDWTGATMNFTYDAAGRLISIGRENGITTSMTHDARNLLLSIQENGSSVTAGMSFTRDGTGRILSASRNLPVTASPPSGTMDQLGYDAAKQTTGMIWDPLGRLTDDGTRSFVWDAASRLSGFHNGSTVYAYEHDGHGQLVRKDDGTTVTTWIWNYALPLPSAAIQDSGGNRTWFVHDPDGRLLYSIDGNGAHRYYHFDEVGNTVFLSDDAGLVTDSYAYSPFGETVARTGTSNNPFTYNGRHGVIHEDGTHIYHMRQRVYDARLRRFLTRDTATGKLSPERLNPYTFAANNPLFYVDPLGQDPVYANSRVDKVASVASDVTELSTYGVADAAENARIKAAQLRLQYAGKTLPGDAAGRMTQYDRLGRKLGRVAAVGKIVDAADKVLTVGKTADLIVDRKNRIYADLQRIQAVYDDRIKRFNDLNRIGALSAAAKERAIVRLNKTLLGELERATASGLTDIRITALKGILNGILRTPTKFALKFSGNL